MAKPSSWSLDDSGKILRYPHVSPNQDFTVKASGELLAADGTRLGRDVVQRVHAGELDPAVGVASQGSGLPAKASRGLPVVSVNVDEIDVEFLRVDEGSLSQFFSEYQRGGRRGSWERERDYGDHVPLSKMAQSVYVNRFVLGGKRNERSLTYLPVQNIAELQEPGSYFELMTRPGHFEVRFGTAFLTVTDIGVHVRASKDKMYVYTASPPDGG